MKRMHTLVIMGIVIGLFFSAGPSLQAAPQGRVVEGLHMNSKLLGEQVAYAIYLPPSYGTGTRKYPVVYLLHGFTDDETAWIQFGEIRQAADQAIVDREIPPMIIVMPDAGVTWYVDDYRNTYPYEQMFVREFIPFIEETYRIRGKQEFRGVSGLSMGGYGSLMYSMRYPSLFAACAAFSAGVMTDQEVLDMPQDRYDNLFGSLFGDHPSGQDRLTDFYEAHNPLHLAETLPPDTLKRTRYYLDVGDDDFLYRGNAALHVTLRNRNVPHEYRVRDGAHNWTYWRTGIMNGLKFIGESFKR